MREVVEEHVLHVLPYLMFYRILILCFNVLTTVKPIADIIYYLPRVRPRARKKRTRTHMNTDYLKKRVMLNINHKTHKPIKTFMSSVLSMQYAYTDETMHRGVTKQNVRLKSLKRVRVRGYEFISFLR